MDEEIELVVEISQALHRIADALEILAANTTPPELTDREWQPTAHEYGGADEPTE